MLQYLLHLKVFLLAEERKRDLQKT